MFDESCPRGISAECRNIIPDLQHRGKVRRLSFCGLAECLMCLYRQRATQSLTTSNKKPQVASSNKKLLVLAICY